MENALKTPQSPRPAALVTGAGRRIGRAIALKLVAAGWDVAIHCGHAVEEAETVARAAEVAGARAVVLPADLADETAVATLVARAAEALGPLRLLVNNASLFEDDRFGGLDREGWDRHFAVNLRAPVVLAEAFAAQAGEGAAIVNLLDQRVLRPNPLFFSYALTKSALWTATQMMAQALAPAIRVNGVAPGPVLASCHQDEDSFAREAAGTLLERPSAPDEIADAVLFLATAPSVTGQLIAVDAGQHLGWRTPDMIMG
ncbi:NAD(P)-dependent dehydrogenase, short-chain alcohol dehydrogenase family [Sphingomonas laterariae]|uniref:NAD(P)-dependent dehydrogenase, short-chain alcohol dehydrogenase family n=1 Tax=Edaphosphingomonas laterariae TaxID=861865 RepID=A0A239DT42_9SPHN|nr:SDR family oxidoreductase [Sphingomonas laterariae]SNS35805.1 NAD(P)-dependent dehydrogenase, short-chain alcohol dehydrogenase family [Sphingomonas laterariae]